MTRARQLGAAVLLVAALGAGCGGAPAVPHMVGDTADQHCLECHRTGEGGAPLTPHPQNVGCAGCHEVGGGTKDVGALSPAD